jgi:hypothetical protein
MTGSIICGVDACLSARAAAVEDGTHDREIDLGGGGRT